jgi:hypothetical protein
MHECVLLKRSQITADYAQYFKFTPATSLSVALEKESWQKLLRKDRAHVGLSSQ